MHDTSISDRMLLASWNVNLLPRGSSGFELLSGQFAESLARVSESSNWAIACLQEPGHIDAQSCYPHKLIYSGDKHGAAVLIHSDLVCYDILIDSIAHQHFAIAVLDFKRIYDTTQCHHDLSSIACVVSTHLPTEDHGPLFYQQVIDELRDSCAKLVRKHGSMRFLLGADANTEIPSFGDVPQISGDHCVGAPTERAMAFLELVVGLNMQLINTFSGPEPQGRDLACTHYSYAHKRLRLIDYVGVPVSFVGCSTWIDRRAAIRSDHYLVWTSLEWSSFIGARATKRRIQTRNSGRQRYRILKGWKAATENALQQYRSMVAQSLSHSRDLQEAGENILRCASAVRHTTSKQRQHVYCPEPDFVKVARSDLRQSVGVEAIRCTSRIYHRALRKYRDMRQCLVRDWDALHGVRRDKEKIATNNVKHGGQLFVDKQDAGDTVFDFFSTLYNPSNLSSADYRSWYVETCDQLIRDLIFWPPLCVPFVLFVRAIESFSQDKAPGRDGVTAEMLQALPWEAKLHLFRLFVERFHDCRAESYVSSWCYIIVHCIPKIACPESLSQWRPISLLSVLLKVHGYMCVNILDQYIQWPSWVLGFMPGRQCMEITCATRWAFHKSIAWGKQVFLCKIDVRKAFDSMRHHRLYQSLRRRGVHPLLILNILREHSNCKCDVNVGGFSTPELVRLLSGGKQGGRDTPKLWNLYLLDAIQHVVNDFERLGLVWKLDDIILNLFIWADDIIVYASSLYDLQLKIDMLVHALWDADLDYKPDEDSLQWFASEGADLAEGTLTVPVRGGGRRVVPCPETINILGIAFDRAASSTAAMHHRLVKANQAWHARTHQLCRRRVPLQARVRRFYSTVCSVVLWGAGEWQCDAQALSRLDAFHMRCLRAIWGRGRGVDETYFAFCHRVNTLIRIKLKVWNLPMLSAMALSYYHSWGGHVMRMPETSPVRQLLLFRDISWRRIQQSLPERQRVRRNRGGPPAEWEDRLVDAHGDGWKTRCGNRAAWKDAEKAFLVNRIWTLDIEITHGVQDIIHRDHYQASWMRDLCLREVGILKGVWVSLAVQRDRTRSMALDENQQGTKALRDELRQACYAFSGHLAPQTVDRGGLRTCSDSCNPAVTFAKLGVHYDADQLSVTPWSPRDGDICIGFCASARGEHRCSAAYEWVLLRDGEIMHLLSRLQSLPVTAEEEDCVALHRCMCDWVRYVYTGSPDG